MFIKRQISRFSNLSVNTLRLLSVEAIANAKSGHPGIALGAAPIMYALFRDHLNVNPKNPDFFDRDRFVLSAGHGSALLYATMLISRYKCITIEDLKKFRQLNSITPGHPENELLKGVEIGTGPLGQGIAMGVGMAMAEAKLAAKFNQYDKLIHHYTYVLFGDGCLQEGVAQEAIAIAGKMKLNKLIMLYDSNQIQLDGKVNQSTKFNVKKLFKANGWNYIRVYNANNTADVSKAIRRAKGFTNHKPTVIECSSIIGYGSRFANSNSVHGSPLNEEQIKELRETLNYKIPSFTIHENVFNDMNAILRRGELCQQRFNNRLMQLESKNIDLYSECIALIENKFNFHTSWFDAYQPKQEMATRNLISDLLQQIAQNNSTLMVGSADLFSSTLAVYKNGLAFDASNHNGQNIYYGVREFAMCAINNGIVAHGGLKAIGSTFLSFSDYAKAAIRLAAISQVPSINIFSHDTLTVGEDGPTHQPIEQISSLRLIPNHNLFRPCNKAESIVALECAMNSKTKPTTIITSRGTFNQFDSNINNARKGGYIFRDEIENDINIISCGSEIDVAIQVSELLKQKNIKAKIISMFNTNIFDQQEDEYKIQVINNKPTISIEFGSTPLWHKYAQLCIGIDEFGKSGKSKDVLQHFNLTPAQISIKIEDWYKIIKGEK